MDRFIRITINSCGIILAAIIVYELLSKKEGLFADYAYPLGFTIWFLFYIKHRRARRIKRELDEKNENLGGHL